MPVCITIFLFALISFSNGKPAWYQYCAKDTIDFVTKVENSSIVVYGKTMGKTLHETSDSAFHVSFRVDCILKGPTTERHITISKAGKIKICKLFLREGSFLFIQGRIEGKTYCQEFPVGWGKTIAFLEQDPSNTNNSTAFIPSDFVEIPFENNVTNELLANTCHLQQLVPIDSTLSIIDLCPNVSTSTECIDNDILNENNDLDSIDSPMVITGGARNEIDNIQSKSGNIQIDVDAKNGVNSTNISIFLFLFYLIGCFNCSLE